MSEDGEQPDALEIVLLNPLRYGGLGLPSLRRWLRRWVPEIAPGAGSLAVLFTSDRGIAVLNRQFRQRDEPTDVLSFPGDGDEHLGDVVVSVPTARRQGIGEGHELARELRLLLLHGVLHCLGYDHENDDGAMDRLELRLRERYLSGE